MPLFLLLFHFLVCCAPPAPVRAPESCTASYFGRRPNACRMSCRMAPLPYGLSLARSAGYVERLYIRSKLYMRGLRSRICAFCVSSVIELRKGLSCFAMNDHRVVIRKVAMSFSQSFAAIGVAVNSCDVRCLGVLQGGASLLMFICPLGLKKFFMATVFQQMKYRDRLRKVLADNASGKYSNYSSSLNEYMAELESKYGNTPYWEKFMSNPSLRLPEAFSDWRSVNAYNQDYIMDMIDEYEKSARTNIDQLIGNIREEGYNSAASQVAREKAAGINADLAGNVSPGDAAEYDDAAGAFNMPSMADYGLQRRAQSMAVANQVFDTLSGVVTAGIGLASQIEGVSGQRASNISTRLSNYETASNYVVKLIADRLPVPKKTDKNPFESPYLVPGDDPDDPYNEKNFGATILAAASSLEKDGAFKNYHRRDRKLLQTAYNQFIQPLRSLNGQTVPSGLAAKYWTNIRDYVNGRTDSIKGMGSSFWSDDFSKSVAKFNKQYGEVQTKVYKILSDYQIAHYRNSKAYEDEADRLDLPEHTAIAENEEAGERTFRAGYNVEKMENAKKMEDYVKDLNTVFDDMEKSLRDSDSWFDKIMLLFTPLARFRTISLLRSLEDPVSPVQAPFHYIPGGEDAANILMGIH